MAIVPLFDFFNHSLSPNVEHELDPSTGHMVCRVAAEHVDANEQLFISYGQHSNGTLLRLYGFTAHDGANPHDAVDLVLTDASSTSFSLTSSHPLPVDLCDYALQRLQAREKIEKTSISRTPKSCAHCLSCGRVADAGCGA